MLDITPDIALDIALDIVLGIIPDIALDIVPSRRAFARLRQEIRKVLRDFSFEHLETGDLKTPAEEIPAEETTMDAPHSPYVTIIAVVKPYLAEAVLTELDSLPVLDWVVHSVKGYGRQKNYLDQYSDTEYALAFLPKVEIEIWADAMHRESIIRAIVQVARSGRMGDGKIFVLPMLSV